MLVLGYAHVLHSNVHINYIDLKKTQHLTYLWSIKSLKKSIASSDLGRIFVAVNHQPLSMFGQHLQHMQMQEVAGKLYRNTEDIGQNDLLQQLSTVTVYH